MFVGEVVLMVIAFVVVAAIAGALIDGSVNGNER